MPTLSESLNAVEEQFSKDLQANIDDFAKFEQEQIAAREKKVEEAQAKEIELRQAADAKTQQIIADFDKQLEEEREKSNNGQGKKVEVNVSRKS